MVQVGGSVAMDIYKVTLSHSMGSHLRSIHRCTGTAAAQQCSASTPQRISQYKTQIVHPATSGSLKGPGKDPAAEEHRGLLDWRRALKLRC